MKKTKQGFSLPNRYVRRRKPTRERALRKQLFLEALEPRMLLAFDVTSGAADAALAQVVISDNALSGHLQLESLPSGMLKATDLSDNWTRTFFAPTDTLKISRESGDSETHLGLIALDADLSVASDKVFFAGHVFLAGHDLMVDSRRLLVEDNVVVSTRNIADLTNVSAHTSADSIGDSGAIEFTAYTNAFNSTVKITVGSGAKLLAHQQEGSSFVAGDITMNASNTIDPVNTLIPFVDILETDARVEIDTATIKGRTVKIDANAESTLAFGSEQESADVGEEIADFFSSASLFGGLAVSNADAHIDILGETLIEAETLNVKSTSLAEAAVEVFSLYAGVGVGISNPNATINIENAHLDVQENLSVTSYADGAVNVFVMTIGGNHQLDVAVGSMNANANTTLGAGSIVDVGGAATIEANTTHSVVVNAQFFTTKGTGGGVVSISDIDSDAIVDFGGRLSVDGPVSIVANNLMKDPNPNITFTDIARQASGRGRADGNETNGSVATGLSPLKLKAKRLVQKRSPASGPQNPGRPTGILGNIGYYLAKIDGWHDAIGRTKDTAKWGYGMAIVVPDQQHNARVTVRPDSQIVSGGDLAIDAQVFDVPDVTADVSVTSNQEDPRHSTGAFSLIGGSIGHDSRVDIGTGASVDAGGDLQFRARNLQPYEITWLDFLTGEAEGLDGFSNFVDHVNGNFGIENGLVTTWSKASASARPGDSETGGAGAASFNGLAFWNEAKVTVHENAAINVALDSADLPFGKVMLEAVNDIEAVHFAGQHIPDSKSTGSGVGASGMYVTYVNQAEAQILDRATVFADALSVFSDNRAKNIGVVTTSGTVEGGFGFNGSVSVLDIDNSTISQISDDANITTGDATVQLPRIFSRVSSADNLAFKTHKTFRPDLAVIDDGNGQPTILQWAYDHEFDETTTVVYDNGGGESIGGLVHGQIYQVIPDLDNSNQLQLAPLGSTDVIAFDKEAATGNAHRLIRTFDATTPGVVTTTTIDLGYEHEFQTGEAVVYRNRGNQGNIGGLVSGHVYYVVRVPEEPTTIQLAASNSEALRDTPLVIGVSAPPSGSFHSIASESPNQVVDLSGNATDFENDTIRLSNHRLESDDQVIYESRGDESIGGLNDRQIYFVTVIDGDTLQLRRGLNETEPVDLVVAPGSSHRLVPPAGNALTFNPEVDGVVDTEADSIRFDAGHQLRTGDAIVYYPGGDNAEPIGGLASGETLYAIVLDDQHIRLAASESLANIGSVEFNPGTAGVIDDASNTIAISGHGFERYDLVTYRRGGANELGDLQNNATYYVIPDGPDRIYLSEVPDSSGIVDLHFSGSPGTTHRLDAFLDLRPRGALTEHTLRGLKFDYIVEQDRKCAPADTQSLLVVACDDSQIYNVGGSIILGKSTGVGATVTRSLITRDTSAFIGNESFDLGAGDISPGAGVNGESDTINFGFPHGFSTGDAVVYESAGEEEIGGLQTGETYYVIASAESPNELRLATTLDAATRDSVAFSPAIAGTIDVQNNRLQVLAHGLSDNQAVVFSEPDGSDVEALQSGHTYYVIKDGEDSFGVSPTAGAANTDTFASSNVDGDNQIAFPAHGLEGLQPVVYRYDGSVPGGSLVNGKTYYVIRVDENTLKLASSRESALLEQVAFDPAISVDDGQNTIRIDNHLFQAGDPVIYRQPSGDVVGDLQTGVTYFVVTIDNDPNHIQLATHPDGTGIVDLGFTGKAGSRHRLDTTLDLSELPAGGGHHLDPSISLSDLENASGLFYFDLHVALDTQVTLGNSHSLGKAFDASAVDPVTDSINLGYVHGFTTGQKVVYSDGGNSSVGSLDSGQVYYAIIDVAANPRSLKLAVSEADALRGLAINVDNDSMTGTKHRIGAVLRTAPIVNDESNTINLGRAHGLSTGDDFIYENNGTGGDLGGLINGSSYFVRAVDDFNFELATSSAFAASGLTIDLDATQATAGGHRLVSPQDSSPMSGFVSAGGEIELSARNTGSIVSVSLAGAVVGLKGSPPPVANSPAIQAYSGPYYDADDDPTIDPPSKANYGVAVSGSASVNSIEDTTKAYVEDGTISQSSNLTITARE